jgi:hypothetical protein
MHVSLTVSVCAGEWERGGVGGRFVEMHAAKIHGSRPSQTPRGWMQEATAKQGVESLLASEDLTANGRHGNHSVL